MALTVLITGANGVVYRLGPDEADAGWVPEGIQWGSALPGGWKEGSFDLRRRSDEDVPLRLFDEVVILNEAADPVYEGRIQQLPRQEGDDFLLGVKCLGWAGHLLDDPSFSMIFRDMDLTGFANGVGRARRKSLIEAGFATVDPTVDGDITNAQPALNTTITAPVPAAGVQASAWYDAGAANPIGSVYAAWQRSTNINPASTEWQWEVIASPTDDLTGGTDSTGNLRAAGPGSVTLTTTTATRRFVMVHLSFIISGAGPPAGEYAIFWPTLAVHGTHGLTKEGVEPNAGFYIDDMLAYALDRAAPKLNFSVGTDGSIQRPPVVISHAAYKEPGTLEPVVLDLNKYVLWDWLVYENRTFFYRPTDPNRLTWRARKAEGTHLALEGDDAEHVYNGCIVKYSIPDGTRRVAGPPGSGFDIEDALLGDANPENTVTAHGYQRKWAELEIQFPILDLYAVTIGSAYLAQAALPARSGTIDLFGFIEHPTKGMRPVHEVRAGDWIQLSDHPTDVPRRILQTQYDHDSLKCTVTVGNEINKIDALLEQLGVLTQVRLGG